MNKKYGYLMIGLIAVLVRFYLNFQTELIPGLNGGYFPVQVRALIQTGTLAFPDMPLLFYLQAMIVKIIHTMFAGINPEVLIIHTSKIIDSLVLPTILFPLYMISRDFLRSQYPLKYEMALAGFLVLSYSPLALTSDFQKNSFALPFMMLFFYHFLMFLKNRSHKSFVYAMIFFTIIGFIHFGVFSVCIIVLILGMVYFLRGKALMPMLIISIFSLALIGAFDFARAERLLLFPKKAITLMVEERILMYPYGIISYLSTYLIILMTIVLLIMRRAIIPDHEKKLLLFSVSVLAIMTFPFLKFEFGRRLGLILFVPLTLHFFFIFPYIKPKIQALIPYVFMLLTTGSLMFHFFNPKQNTITDEAYADLKNMKTVIENPTETIIFARHGLDWWVAWAMKTKIAISYRIPLDDAIMGKYGNVLIIQQKRGRNKDYPGENSPFTPTMIPENNMLIYHSPYFDLFKPVAKIPLK